MYLRLKNGMTQFQKIYWSVNMIWASSLSKLKPSTVSSKVALRYFMILSAHDYSILQYPSETLNTIWSSAGQWLVVNINKLFAQLHCLLGFGAKLESLSAYQPFWIFNGPFWFGVHQQGPGSLQISTAEAPSPWQTSRAPQGANDSFVWKSRGCQACFTKKEESPHEVETFFKDTGCVKQNFELQVKTFWVGLTLATTPNVSGSQLGSRQICDELAGVRTPLGNMAWRKTPKENWWKWKWPKMAQNGPKWPKWPWCHPF